jgi:ATPase family associated with various cellular activities (AAA)
MSVSLDGRATGGARVRHVAVTQDPGRGLPRRQLGREAVIADDRQDAVAGTEQDVPASSPGVIALSSTRLVALSRRGRFVVTRRAEGTRLLDGLEAIDLQGISPRRVLPAAGLCDFDCIGDELWWVADGTLCRHDLERGELLGRTVTVGNGPGRLQVATGDGEPSALWLGHRRLLLSGRDGGIEVNDISQHAPADAFAGAISGTRFFHVDGREVHVREAGRPERSTSAIALPGTGGEAVVGGVLLHSGGLVLLSALDGMSCFDVVRPGGALVHHIEVSQRAGRWALAEKRGLALMASPDQRLVAVDLRFGRVALDAAVPSHLEIADLAIDAAAQTVALAAFRREGGPLILHAVPYAELVSPARHAASTFAVVAPAPPSAGVIDPSRESGAASADAARGEVAPPETWAPPRDEIAAQADPAQPVPDLALAALGMPSRPAVPRLGPAAAPFGSPAEHLAALLDLAAAWAERSIARAWDSGRLAQPRPDDRPYQQEVEALLGDGRDQAHDLLAAAEARASRLTEHIAEREQATLAGGDWLPLARLVAEFGLSPTARDVLVAALAPGQRGEIARLYGILSDDEGRPVCDRYLIELLLGGYDYRVREQVVAELEPDAPLLRFGLVRTGRTAAAEFLYAPLTVEPVLVARIRGNPCATGASKVAVVRESDRALSELAIPHQVKREMILALARRTPPGRPVRMVLRGRPGSGRTATLAALAARAERPLVLIDAELMPRGRIADSLASELRLSLLSGAVPCVSGLEFLGRDDSEGVRSVREAFRAHPGPIAFRASPELQVPLDPGFLDFSLPALGEGERLEFWRGALERRGLPAAGVPGLAARYRVGPGTIERVVSQVAWRVSAEPVADVSAELDRAARQHVEVRLASVAKHIDRLARWENVALPGDVIDSIREFVGRVKHRRTVYESWGFDSRMTTARGLVALFYGPPGTGKTMVAGLIARELGLDLYRVDLARITSKWIGETEKNLAAVFDAAEDGQVLILFDEADSLFARRTEVKSSVDRYANLEVNYLLQRLDSFEGVAILTTNLEGSIDQAFKRRMTLRLQFPFPDEEMRVRLWTAHIPHEIRERGAFDFAELARRFPLSGGYIRNSAVRAAFLAAQEDVPLSQDHLVRAIQLEYRELGKLSTSGRME